MKCHFAGLMVVDIKGVGTQMFPFERIIRITDEGSVTSEEFNALMAENLPSLTKILIKNNANLSNFKIKPGMTYPNLKTLKLTDTNISIRSLIDLIDASPRLHDISLLNCQFNNADAGDLRRLHASISLKMPADSITLIDIQKQIDECERQEKKNQSTTRHNLQRPLISNAKKIFAEKPESKPFIHSRHHGTDDLVVSLHDPDIELVLGSPAIVEPVLLPKPVGFFAHSLARKPSTELFTAPILTRSSEETLKDSQRAAQLLEEFTGIERDIKTTQMDDLSDHPSVRIDCISQKNIHQREPLIDISHDHVKVHRAFTRVGMSLQDKATIILMSLLGSPPFVSPLPTTLYFQAHPKHQALINTIQEQFELLKSQQTPTVVTFK